MSTKLANKWRACLSNPGSDLVAILLAATIPFLKTGFKGLIYPVDTKFPLYPSDTFANSLQMWYHCYPLLGTDATLYLAPTLPYNLLLASLNVLPLSIAVLQRVWLVLLMAFAGWSMYYLMSVIVGGTKSRQACFMASIFYMFNPWVILMIRGGGLGPYLLAYAALPLLVGLYIRGLASEKGANKYAVLCGIVSVAVVVVNVQLSALSLVILVMFLLFTVVLHLRQREKVRHALVFTAKAAAIGLAANLWWILPMIYNRNYLYEWQSANIDFAESLGGANRFCHLTDVLRLLGSEHGSWPLGSFYSSSIGYIVGFTLPVIAFMPLMLRWGGGMRKYVLFFSGAGLVFAVLNMGGNPPFGSLYEWLLLHAPLGKALVPYDPARWAHFLSLVYAVLFGLAAVAALDGWDRFATASQWRPRPRLRLRSIVPFLIVGTLIVVLLANSWPLVTGDLRGYLEPVQIPQEYRAARSWLQADEDNFRVLVVPPPYWASYVKYEWAPYVSVDITEMALPKAIVEDLPGFTTSQAEMPRAVTSSIYSQSGDGEGFAKVLSLMNVKYVLFRHDLGENSSYSASFEEMEQSLVQQKGIDMEEQFGDLDFYRNETWQPLSVYAASSVVPVEGGVVNIMEAVESEEVVIGQSVVFLSGQASESQWQFIREHHVVADTSTSPVITIHEASSSSYRIDVSGASQPFFLVLGESFHPEWKAYVDKKGNDTNWLEALYKKTVSAEGHLVANGYANAWYIDPSVYGEGDSFTVTLYYRSQSLFYVGLLVSLLSLVGCAGCLAWHLLRRSKAL
jgi:hypothetical protein